MEKVASYLQLEDGTVFAGVSFGAPKSTAGEVVFNTGMVGYPETLTDPSYSGQVLVLTYPLVGNYGVPVRDVRSVEGHVYVSPPFESGKIQVQALVVSDYSEACSHYLCASSLGSWLDEESIPGLSGVDTRALTKHIRVAGSMLGRILYDPKFNLKSDIFSNLLARFLPEDTDLCSLSRLTTYCDEGQQEEQVKFTRAQLDEMSPWFDPNAENVVAKACRTTQSHIYTPQTEESKQVVPCEISRSRCLSKMDNKTCAITKDCKIVLVDFGVKENLLREMFEGAKTLFADFTITLKIVSWDYPFGDEECMDGLLLSNGPGDPQKIASLLSPQIQKTQQRGVPIFGVCLGHQLLALSVGGKTYKMKFGNRGLNQPVVNLTNGKCFITSQNHGFAVDPHSLDKHQWVESWVNANDRTNEGISHITMPWFSVQFHPEAAPGALDTRHLFAKFLNAICSPSHNNAINLLPLSFGCMRAKKVLLLGSGGLSIGQAGEFDYSGSQAIKALKEAGVYVIVLNPNIATVQTTPNLADRIYLLPVSPEFVTEIIQKEKPDALLCAFGGQTALNCAVKLHQSGVLQNNRCKVLGTPIHAIIATEDRQLFAQKMQQIGQKCAPSHCVDNLQQCLQAANKLGYPVLVRCAYALGGLGSGFANSERELIDLVRPSFGQGRSLIVDASLRGWKEVEYEVMRDGRNNCLTICNMENFDPLGIHTGDSIVVAPSQTLSASEYYVLREASIKIVRHLGVIGECNVQFALDPFSARYYVIEVNARLSRSSALASKVTGYPLAYVSCRIALGDSLLDIPNSVTKCTTAFFEPALDYVVTKVPRWDLAKFSSVDSKMGSAMKSVGEVMAVGRSFEESFQKALRMVDESCTGFEGEMFISREKTEIGKDEIGTILETELNNPSHRRVWAIAAALERGYSVSEIHSLTKIDSWFLHKLSNIDSLKKKIPHYTDIDNMPEIFLSTLKKAGFADTQIASHMLEHKTTAEDIRQLRIKRGLHPFVKLIDTLAGEFPAETNYLYTTYHGVEHDVQPLSRKTSHAENEVSPEVFPESEISTEAVLVLGCGCYRIGSSVEFDWSAMSCVRTVRNSGRKAIVINCNPETVSTDFDASDRLYFEELSLESILEIENFENSAGVILSVGGQMPNNLAMPLHARGVKILGTSAESIDLCEDRGKFSELCDQLKIAQPSWSTFTQLEFAKEFADAVTYPVLVRPSYVLSGASMQVAVDGDQLDFFLRNAAVVSREHPVVISKYIENAKEVEMDAVACEGEILNYAISEHVENAGIHSGDATLVLPAQKLYVETMRQVRKLTRKLARALNITGPFNVQYLCQHNDVKIIECNLRASRTFPFISKTFRIDFIELATKSMLKLPVKPAAIQLFDLDFVGVKVPMFSFTRLRGADPVLGVEMQSTGEVACFGSSQHECLLKALLSAGHRLPLSNIVISIGPLSAKLEFEPYVHQLLNMGFDLHMTQGTYDFYTSRWDNFAQTQNIKDCSGSHYFSQLSAISKTNSDEQNNSISHQHHVQNKTAPPQQKFSPKKKLTDEKGIEQNIGCQKSECTKIDGNRLTHSAEETPTWASQVHKRAPGKISKICKPQSGEEPNVITLIHTNTDLVINVPDSKDRKNQSLTDGYKIRTAATNSGIHLLTNVKLATLYTEALVKKLQADLAHKPFWEILPLDHYNPH